MAKATRSICPFCSMGCSLLLKAGTGAPYIGQADVPVLDYDADGPFNRGSLCAKGNMALELLTHPHRIEAPALRSDSHQAEASWEDAMELIRARVEWIRSRHGPRSIALMAGPHLTNEEAAAVGALGRHLGTPHVDAGQPEDRVLLGGIESSCATPEPVTSIEQIEKMTATLVVGDLFCVAPCLSRSILESRYDRRQNVLGTLGGTPTRTTWFGKPDLRCAPAHETAALASLLVIALEEADPQRDLPWRDAALQALEGRELQSLSGLDPAAARRMVMSLREEEHTGIFITATFGGSERPDLMAGLAALLAQATGSRFLDVGHGPNSRGVRRMLAEAGYPDSQGFTAPEMIEATLKGDLHALLVFGCDCLGGLPGGLAREAMERLSLFVMTAPMPGVTTDLAHVILPTTAWGEKTGIATNAFGADQELAAVLTPPGASRADLEILVELRKMLEPAADPLPPPPAQTTPCPETGFFSELDLYLRFERRELGAQHTGSHLLLPEVSPFQSGDGWLTRALSWPRHEEKQGEVVLSASHASELGVRAGDAVRVRGSTGEAVLGVRVEPRLPPGIVLAPAHLPEVRGLMEWRVDAVLRDFDLQPGRVSIEPVGESLDV